MIDLTSVYPLTIVLDRYNGVYSGGEYTAWNLFTKEVPSEIDDDDLVCARFWEKIDNQTSLFNNKIPVGIGRTPDEAVEDLIKKLEEDKK